MGIKNLLHTFFNKTGNANGETEPKVPVTYPISKIDMEAMPIAHFDGPIIIVDTNEAMIEAYAQIKQLRVWGFDTETRPSFHKGEHNNVALLQISDGIRCWLIRLCKLTELQLVASLFTTPNVLKVGLSTHDDLRAISKLIPNCKPTGFTDLQWLMHSRQITDISLRKLAARVLGIRISKKQQLTNWEAQVLTEAQQRYAATDAWVTLLIYYEVINGNYLRPDLAHRFYLTQNGSTNEELPELTTDYLDSVTKKLAADAEFQKK